MDGKVGGMEEPVDSGRPCELARRAGEALQAGMERVGELKRKL